MTTKSRYLQHVDPSTTDAYAAVEEAANHSAPRPGPHGGGECRGTGNTPQSGSRPPGVSCAKYRCAGGPAGVAVHLSPVGVPNAVP